jgi:sugar O-acyltransferase (sialic acid O-acetyltransferase NeuD family)
MLIIGAKAFAKEILEVCHENNDLKNLCFYDDINKGIGDKLYNRFPILRSLEEADYYFKNIDQRFSLGLGRPTLRKKLADQFLNIGGTFTGTISKTANIGNFGTFIADGCNVLSGSIISNDVCIGTGCIIYFNTVITHDCLIGDFVEISPGVNLLGRVSINSYSHIGAGSIILPDIIIGRNVIIGAGSVVTKNIPDNSVAFGSPAKVIRQIKALT